MEAEIRSNNSVETINRAKICEDIFDSVTIYIHITTNKDDIHQGEEMSILSFSNIPFSDPAWKDNLFHMKMDVYAPGCDAEAIKGISYNIHKKLMLDMGYILTIRGHEVYVCVSQNPSEKNGTYSLLSKPLKEKLSELKETVGKEKENLEIEFKQEYKATFP